MNRIPMPDRPVIPSRQELWLIAFARGLSQMPPAEAGMEADEALALHDAKWPFQAVISPKGGIQGRDLHDIELEAAEEAAKRIPPRFYTRTPHELRYRELG